MFEISKLLLVRPFGGRTQPSISSIASTSAAFHSLIRRCLIQATNAMLKGSPPKTEQITFRSSSNDSKIWVSPIFTNI